MFRNLYLVACLLALVVLGKCAVEIVYEEPVLRSGSLVEEDKEVRAALLGIISRYLIPEDYVQAYMDKFVSQMDYDKNGFIQKKEYIRWLVEFDKKFNKDTNKEKFESYDKNNNSYVDFSEFIHKTLDDYKELHPDSSIPDSEIVHEKSDMFLQADDNSDHQLDEEEFMALLYPFFYPRMMEALVRQLLRFDDDRDRSLSYEEFANSFPDPLEEEGRAARAFRRCDKDSDKALNWQEMECLQTFAYLMNFPTVTLSKAVLHEDLLSLDEVTTTTSTTTTTTTTTTPTTTPETTKHTTQATTELDTTLSPLDEDTALSMEFRNDTETPYLGIRLFIDDLLFFALDVGVI